MVEDNQNSVSLQPTGPASGGTNNPQQLPQTGSLQPQTSAQLQPSAVVSPENLAGLDQGTTAIQLNTISATTTIPAQPSGSNSQSSPVLLYGLVAVMCAVVFVCIVRGFVKHRA